MKWILWAIVLLIQNASFTLVSRARNSNSVLYHGVAALGSNGVWFASQFILVGEIFHILKSGTIAQAIGVGVFYTIFTMIGSIGMHYIAMKKIEPKVGARV